MSWRWRTILSLCLMLVLPTPAVAVDWPPSTDLVVGEIVTGGDKGADEYFELFNAGDTAVPLGGLEVVYITASGKTTTRKRQWADGQLPAGARLLLANDDGGPVRRFELVGGSGLAAGSREAVSVEAGAGALGTALGEPRPTRLDVRSPDAEGWQPWMPAGAAALVVPCVACGSVVGAVVVFDPDHGHLFAPDTVSSYSVLAAQIGAPLALAKRVGEHALTAPCRRES